MAKNIMLIFMSDVKTKLRDGKVAVSEATYTNVDGEKTLTTNESAVRYVLQKVTPTLDKIFIIASKMVRENDIVARDGTKFLFQDQPIKHLEYFKLRMKNFLPNVDACINDETVYPYDEKNSQNLKSVAEMAGRIQNYSAQIDDEVVLHVDFSGGMRNVNMLMLDVIRLLEYSGITIGKLLYSNYNPKTEIGTVEEVKDIYDMFQLISGVEEFVQFGSVKALKKYYTVYKDNISTPLKNLINAMENFSEAIKLCHYGQFRESIENLHDAVNDFESNSDNVQDIIMERLIGRIKKDYEQLIKTRELDDLRVIRWCINNGYMQQALTLYTERVPEYLGQTGFIFQSEKESINLKKLVANDSMHRNAWYFLLNECKPRKNHLDKGISKFCYELKNTAMLAIRKNKFNYEDWWKNLNEQLESQNISCVDEKRLRLQLELLVQLKNNPEPLTNLASEKLEPIRAIINEIAPRLDEISEGWQRYRQIDTFISTEIKNPDMKKFFPTLKFARYFAEKYPNSLTMYEMIVEKIFEVKIPVETFLSIMDKYFRIKTERNQSNHAREDYIGEFPTAELLRKFMTAGLDEIESAKKFLGDGI